jgi:hypothetical protein
VNGLPEHLDEISGIKARVHLKTIAIRPAGYKDIKTVMIYTHVLNRGSTEVRSSVDGL